MPLYRFCEICGSDYLAMDDRQCPNPNCKARVSRVGGGMIPQGESGFRYCQRCSKKVFLQDVDRPNPCVQCGGTNYDLHPKKHVGVLRCWYLTDEDKVFLRVQRIKPEDF